MLLLRVARYCTDSVDIMPLVGSSSSDLVQDLPSKDRSKPILRLPHWQNTTTSG